MKLFNRLAAFLMLVIALLFVTRWAAAWSAPRASATSLLATNETVADGGLCDLTINVNGTGSVDVVRTNNDPDMVVELDEGWEYAVLENSEIRVKWQKYTDIDGSEQFAIREFQLKKANNIEQAGAGYLDAAYNRGSLRNAEILYDGPDRKTLRLEWNGKPGIGQYKELVSEISIFPNSRFIKIDYEKVAWGYVIVDLGLPGGTYSGANVAYGAESWRRGYVAYPESYYSRLPQETYDDPADGGSLNYNDHFIVGVYAPNSEIGLGRVFPIAETRSIKFLLGEGSRRGFEVFPPDFNTDPDASYTSYLYPVIEGPDEIIEQGKRLVDAVDDDYGYQCGEVVELTAVPDTGWYFSDWTGDVPGTDETISLTLTGQHTVTANFGSDFYALNVNVVPADGSGGTVSKSPDKVSYQYGEEVDLTAVPKPGWTFDGWSGALSGSNLNESVTMTTDRTVTATFTQDQYTLTTPVTGSGSVMRQPDKPTYAYDEIVVLTAVPDPGWSFGGWDGGQTGNPVPVKIQGDTTVPVTFTQDQYTINLVADGPGAVQIAPEQASYVYGDVVTLTAVPDAGNYFSGWHGDLSSTANPRELEVQGNMTVVGLFSSTPPNTYLPLILGVK